MKGTTANSLPAEEKARTLIVGLGNPLLTDDAVGLRAAAALRECIPPEAGVDVIEDYRGGLRLMECMIGYDRVVIIDALLIDAPPGSLHFLSVHDIPTQRSASAHDVNLPTALDFGRRAGARLPSDEDILLIGVAAGNVETFDEVMSPAVEAAVDEVVSAVLEHLGIGERCKSR